MEKTNPSAFNRSQSRNTLNRVILFAVLALGLTLTLSMPAGAVDRTVCNSGCSYNSIQAAINASADGDTVKVAQGPYNESLIIQNKGLTLLGGFTPSNFTTPATDPNLTVIDASGKNDSAVYIGSGVPGKTVRLENFTIKNGTGRFDGSFTSGGGIRVQKVTATIRNNIIENNTADAGAGIQLTDDYNPLTHLVENNVIRNNVASNARGIGFGGGIDINTSNATIRGNTISGNQARCGGGIVSYASGVTIERNKIINNQANFTNAGQGCVGGDGGGLFIELVGQSPVVRNNLVANNSAARGDGVNIAIGPGQPKIVNNTIANNKNSTGFDDGIFYVGTGITPIIRNNIVVFNGSGIHRGNNVATPDAIMSNNLVYGNEQTNYRNLAPGSGDISANPLFVNQAGGDYHLQAGSPAIDKGTSTDAPNVDLDGQARPVDGDTNGSAEWDIGAYEFGFWILKQANTLAVEPGDTVQFTIKYNNNGGTTATGVVISDILSSDLENISFSSSGAAVTARGGAKYTWDVQDLAPGQGGTIFVTAQVKRSVNTPRLLVNTTEFTMSGQGPYSSQVALVVGGIKSFLPIILKH